MLVSQVARSAETLGTPHRTQQWISVCCWKKFRRCNNLIQVVYLFCIILFCFRPEPPLVEWLALFCWLRIFVNSKFSILSHQSCLVFLLIAYSMIRSWAELYFLFVLRLMSNSPTAQLQELPPKRPLCRPKRSWVWTLADRLRTHKDSQIPYLYTYFVLRNHSPISLHCKWLISTKVSLI